jgi:hypothetical protein
MDNAEQDLRAVKVPFLGLPMKEPENKTAKLSMVVSLL